MWASFMKDISLELSKEEKPKVKKRSIVNRILNRHGYYKPSQLKVGGTCGCCGKHDPKIIWVDDGRRDMFAGIGVCQECCGHGVENEYIIKD